jgi:predicted nucleotidyltransferase
MPEFQVERILATLTRHGVDFVVVGGIAATLLGSARDTFDLDICPAFDARNLDSLGKALGELNGRLRGVDEHVPFTLDGRTLRNVELLTLDTEAGPLDILMRPHGGPRYEELRRRAERKALGSFSVLVASIEDLIAMKEAAGRPKDLVVVEELEAIKRLRRRLGVED